MKYIKVIFLVAFFVVSIMFFSQNNDTLAQSLVLKLNVPYGPQLHSLPLPFFMLVLGGFLCGALLSMIYFLVDKFSAARKLKECRTRMASLEQELNSLRNMPIIEEASATVPALEEETKAESESA